VPPAPHISITVTEVSDDNLWWCNLISSKRSANQIASWYVDLEVDLRIFRVSHLQNRFATLKPLFGWVDRFDPEFNRHSRHPIILWRCVEPKAWVFIVQSHCNLWVIACNPVKLWFIHNRSICSLHSVSTFSVLNLSEMRRNLVEQKVAATCASILHLASNNVFLGQWNLDDAFF